MVQKLPENLGNEFVRIDQLKKDINALSERVLDQFPKFILGHIYHGMTPIFAKIQSYEQLPDLVAKIISFDNITKIICEITNDIKEFKNITRESIEQEKFDTLLSQLRGCERKIKKRLQRLINTPEFIALNQAVLQHSAQKTLDDIEVTKDEVNEKFKEIKDTRDSVKAMAGETAESTITGHYQKYAEQNGISSDKWRSRAIIALAFAGLVALTALIAGVHAPHLGLEKWPALVKTTTLVVILLTMASYFAGQSKSYRNQYLRAYSMYLRLNTLDPYLAKLDRERKENSSVGANIKEQIAIEIFTKDQLEPEPSINFQSAIEKRVPSLGNKK